MSLSSSNSDPRTVPHLSKHPRCLEHCWRFRDVRATTVHRAPLTASRNPGGQFVIPASLPRCPSFGVSSSSAVQQPYSLVSSPSGASCSRSATHPSLGHNLAGCAIPPHTWDVRPLPCRLSSTPAFALAFPLGFSMTLPASVGCGHGRRLPAAFYFCEVPCHGPPVEASWVHLPFLPFSSALTLRSRAERFNNSAQRLCELLNGAGVAPSLASSAKFDVISLSFN